MGVVDDLKARRSLARGLRGDAVAGPRPSRACRASARLCAGRTLLDLAAVKRSRAARGTRDLATHGLLETVRLLRSSRAVELHGADVEALVDQLQLRYGHTAVAAVAAGRIGVVRLSRRNRRADVSRRSARVGAILEAEIGRNRDRQQDADDHDDDEELDQREPFLTLEPLPQLVHGCLLRFVDLHKLFMPFPPRRRNDLDGSSSATHLGHLAPLYPL